jgi:hypothetical protein
METIDSKRYFRPGTRGDAAIQQFNLVVKRAQDAGMDVSGMVESANASLANKDIGSFIASFQGLSGQLKNYKPVKKEEKESYQPQGAGELFSETANLLQMSDEMNIPLPPDQISEANKALSKGEVDRAGRIYSALQQRYDAIAKQQIEEDKKLVTLDDGNQVLVGQKTGTRYSPSGRPISSGPVNTQYFNLTADRLGSALKMHASDFSEGEGAVFNGTAYESNVPGDTTVYEKMKADVPKARELWMAGKPDEALDLMMAMKFNSPWGGPMDKETLRVMWGDLPPPPDEAKPEPVTEKVYDQYRETVEKEQEKRTARPPIGDRLKEISVK